MERACSDLAAGFQEFQGRCNAVLQATQKAQQELKQERAKLAEEREAFAEERSRIQQAGFSSIVALAVSASKRYTIQYHAGDQ